MTPIAKMAPDEFRELLRLQVESTKAQDDIKTKTRIQMAWYLDVLDGKSKFEDRRNITNERFFNRKDLRSLGYVGIVQDLYIRMAMEVSERLAGSKIFNLKIVVANPENSG